MYKTIQTFFTPTQKVAKGLLKMALFAAIISSSVFPTVSFNPSHSTAGVTGSLGVAVAHADVCAVAMALGDEVDNATPSVGDTITYTLVGAPAFTASTQVTVADALPSGLTYVSSALSVGTFDGSTGTWNVGTLSSSVHMITLTITAKVNAGTEGQTITTTPTITYVKGSCTESQAVAGATIKVKAAVTPTIQNADLAIAKTVDNATPHSGDTVHYSLNVTNVGPATSTGATVADALPSGLTFVNATASVGSYANATGIWTIGDMPASSAATLTIAATVNASVAGTTITNTGTVTETASTTDPNLANNSSSVSIVVQAPIAPTIQNADIAIVKTADVAKTVEGATVHYTLTATDLGPATSTSVVANDVLPSGLAFVSANASVGTYAHSTGVWTIGDMAANSSATLTIAATVKTGTASSTIGNTATIAESASSTDPNLANNSSTVTIAVAGNPIGTCSIATALGETVSNATPSVGDTITYTLVGAPAFTVPTHLIVTELLPSSYLTFVSASTSDGAYTSSTGVWDLGTLNGANTITLAITATVNAAAAGQAITTTPSIHYVQSGCTQTSAAAGATITVPSIVVATTTADIAIQKTADVATTTTGLTVHYALTVSANGPATSTGVAVTDTLPSGITFVSATSSNGTYVPSTGVWSIGDMTAGATSTLQIAATVNASAAGTTITNTGTVSESASSTDPDLANNSSSVSIVVASNGGGGSSADIAIQKTADVATTTTGSTVHYALIVTNHGPDASTGVVANDVLPSGLTPQNATASVGTYVPSTGVWTIGTLSANATATLAIAALVDASAASSTVTNTAHVTESPSITDPNPANNSSSVSIIVAPNSATTTADIAIAKTVDATSTVVGATLHYVLTATNAGPAASIGTVATDTLPSGLTFVSATSSSGTAYNFGTGVWTIGTLQANATATLAIAATVGASAAGTTVVNTATITESASSTDPDLANNSSSVSTVVAGGGGGGSSADISIAKTVDHAYPNPGDTVNYKLIVTNAGPSTSEIDVAQDALPMGLTFVSATSSSGTAYNFGTGVWTIGTLQANATATLAIAATVGANQGGQTITNTATVSQLSSITDPSPANNSSSVSIFVATSTPYADLSIVKTVDKGTANAGDTLNYTLTVAANGPATSTGVVATDTLPSGLTFVNATASLGTYATSTGTWTIGDMSASSTATLTIAATVNAISATTVSNTAIVGESASSTDPNLANNSSTVSTVIPGGGGGCTSNCGGGGGSPTAEIAIAKTVDNANPSTGAMIHYTVTVSALGPSASLGVVATDMLPSGVAFVSASTTVGTYNSAAGAWSIGGLNNGQKAVLTITATVTAPAGTSITNTGTVRESPVVVDQLSNNNTASVTVTVAGGGGGGGGGGQVLGASTSTGQVLGENTCGLYLYNYIHPNRKNLNDSSEVKKLQVFLNLELNAGLPVTGYYGPLTIAAVNKFQVKYHTEVLQSWVPLGLPNEFTPTSYVYETTRRWINLIVCPSLNLPMPALQVDNAE